MSAGRPSNVIKYILPDGRMTLEGLIYFTKMTDDIASAAVPFDPSTIEADITTIEADITTIEADITTIEADITTIEADAVDLAARVTALEDNIPNLDAFGRLRVSEPHTLFDSKQIFDNQPNYWDDQEVSGSGTTSTHTATKAASTMGVAVTTAGKRVRQTFQRFNYQPGKSQLFLMTGVQILSGGGTGITTRIGPFDDDNGIFAQYDAGVLGLTIRSNFTGTPVDNTITQASWNGDKLDGTGKSGITIDPTTSSILAIDMEWLGVGSVRVYYVINGEFILCHTFHNANINPGVYMSTPNLPIRYEIENDGTGAASTMMHICSSVISEGGVQDTGRLYYASTGGTHVDANVADTIYAVVGLRLKTDYIGQQIDIESISMVNATNDNFEWLLLWNPTVAGTFTFSDYGTSALQVATGATANTVTGGDYMSGGLVASSTGGGSATSVVDTALKLGAAIDGTRDEIVLCVRPFSANADIDGGISWRESA